MKVKHNLARTNPCCIFCSSKRFLYDARIDSEYYGKCISLREKLLLRKLFGAAYNDIIQMLPGVNAKRKSSENFRLSEETIKIAKSRLISHALKIVNIDNPADSKMLSDCCSCGSYGSTIPLCEHDRKLRRHGVYTNKEFSGCRVETAKRVGKQQVKRIWSDFCIYKFNDSKDYPFKCKNWNENKTTFFKNNTEDRQTRLVHEISDENLTTFKIPTPISRAYKIETGKIQFENIKNRTNESMYILKQSPPITHRPPYYFMDNPRISLNKLNNCEPNIKLRYDKDATGDTNYETVTNIQQFVKSNDEKYDTNLIRLALRRCLKPHHNQLDVKMGSKTVAKSLRLIIQSLSSQSKSVSKKSKIIKKINKNNIAKVHRFRKNFNIVKNITDNNRPKQEVHLSSYLHSSGPGSKDHLENNLNFGIRNNLPANVFCFTKTPQISMNLERQSYRSKKSTSPVAKFQFDSSNEVQEMNKLSGEYNRSYKFISLNCKPEIGKFGSTSQNIIYKKSQILCYECKPVFNRCIPHETLVSTNKIKPNEHRSSDWGKLGTHRSEPKSTNIITQKHNKHMKTANVQTSFNNQSNKISINLKLNQAVQVNSSFYLDTEFYDKKSPHLHDAHICQCGRQYRDAGFQTIETQREDEGPRRNCGKTLDTDSSYAKNFSIESDAQSGFFTSKLHKMGRNIFGTTIKEVKYSRKGIVSKKMQLKSFLQDNDIISQDFGFLTDISCERPIPCTSNKKKIASDFIIQSKRIIQRTKSTQTFSSPLINNSLKTNIRSYQAAGSEIMNTEFSQNLKKRHAYVPNSKPYLIFHDLSNKYRHSDSPVELIRERTVKCETSLSRFSSIIGDTTTTTSGSSHSFPSAKYNKYKQNTSHRVKSIYKSSFYALNINVKNTRTDTRETKFERKKRLAEAETNNVTSDTGPNTQEPVTPRHLANRPSSLDGRRSQTVRISSNFSFDVEFSKSSVPARDLTSERKQDRGEGPASGFISERSQEKDAVSGPDFISERKQDKGAASMQTHSNRRVNQGTHTVTNKKRHNAVSQSQSDMQHVGINTHPKRCFCTLKLHKMGRVYKEKGVAAKLYQPKPNVFKETGTVTTKENTHNAAIVEVDLEPYECEPGTDPQECLKIKKNRKMKTRAVGAHIEADQKKDIPSTMAPGQKKESIQACRITSNFSFSIEFVKTIPEEENNAVEEIPNGFNFMKGLLPVNLNKKCRCVLEKLAYFRKKDQESRKEVQNQNSNKSVQSNVKYRPDVKKVKEVGQNSKFDMETDINSKHMKERNTTTHSKKGKKRQKVNEVVRYRLEDLDPYECEPGTCIPGECDPNVCFEIIKKRGGMGSSMGTGVRRKHTNEGTTTTQNKKDKKRKPVNEVVKYRLEDLDPYECEPGTCIPGECDPNVCFEIIKKRGMGISMGTGVKPKHTNERTTATQNKKEKQRKPGNEVVKYRLEDLDPYECEPGTCIPGECDPDVCFEIIKKRGNRATIETDVRTKYSNNGTTTTHNKKDKKRKTVNSKRVKDSGIQGMRAVRDHDSQGIPEHYQKPSKTGAILKRCFCTAKLHSIELPLALSKSKKVKQKETKKNTKKTKIDRDDHSHSSQTIKPGREFNLLNLEPYECEPGVCMPGKCDPNICYERIERRKGIQNISTQSNHNSKSVKAGKHKADHDSKYVKARKHTAAMTETEKLQDGDHTSKNPSISVVRIGSNLEFNVEFSRQISGIGDGPNNTKPNTKQNMVSGIEVSPNPKTKKQKMVSGTGVAAKPKNKAKGSGHFKPPAQSQDSQVVRGKTADQSSGIGIVLRRCFCTLSLQGRSKKLKASENNTKKVKKVKEEMISESRA